MTDRRSHELWERLESLDGRGYRDYKSVKGRFQFDRFAVSIDHVQGDPFAALSKVRIFVSNDVCGFDDWYFQNNSRLTALCDFLSRSLYKTASRLSRSRGSGHSGKLSIDKPGQELLPRSSVFYHEGKFEVRFLVGLPADGRRVLGRVARDIFEDDIPRLFDESLIAEAIDMKHLRKHAEVNEDADDLRRKILEDNLIGFVADGAFLARESGVSDLPMTFAESVQFSAPDSMRCSFELPHAGVVSGMGIRKGVTLITGGGYHGKSTLLRAIEVGVFNHIFGDGREFVVADRDAVKIRAEDGRQVSTVNITPFINNLPTKALTESFSTNNASGSTSQAANIMEALEMGATTLLIDEDTSATNFMIRDRRMQELIASDDEPITPLIDRIHSLVEEFDLSIVAVIGGSGDYLDHANCVVGMNSYRPVDLTVPSKQICEAFPTDRKKCGENLGKLSLYRQVYSSSLSARQGRRDIQIKIRSTDEIMYGEHQIDLSLCEQFVHSSQLQAVAYAMLKIHQNGQDLNLREACEAMEGQMHREGLACLADTPDGNLVMFRKYELAAAINRCRGIVIKK